MPDPSEARDTSSPLTRLSLSACPQRTPPSSILTSVYVSSQASKSGLRKACLLRHSPNVRIFAFLSAHMAPSHSSSLSYAYPELVVIRDTRLWGTGPCPTFADADHYLFSDVPEVITSACVRSARQTSFWGRAGGRRSITGSAPQSPQSAEYTKVGLSINGAHEIDSRHGRTCYGRVTFPPLLAAGTAVVGRSSCRRQSSLPFSERPTCTRTVPKFRDCVLVRNACMRA